MANLLQEKSTGYEVDMRFQGQVQTAIELLGELRERQMPADKHMAYFFRNRRYIGSKDKGVIADLVYGSFREQGVLTAALRAARLPVDSRGLILAYLARFSDSDMPLSDVFGDDKYQAKALSKLEKQALETLKSHESDRLSDKLNFPQWLAPYLESAFGADLESEMQGMNGRATSDIRVNTLKTTRAKLKDHLISEGFEMYEGDLSPLCLRMNDRRSLFGLDIFKQGHFEMQDEGSQLIAAACDVKSGMKVVDFCAGAGGKTLALAAAMQNKGGIVACDIHERRLKEMPKRLKRAGVHNVQPKLLEQENDKWVKRQKEKMDVVLVDAPCSGTGTWRRSPDARWRLTSNTLVELQEIQASILASASRMVKVGGRLVYATCSVLKEENEKQVEAFLAQNPQFALLPQNEWSAEHQFPESDQKGMLSLSPKRHGTDGFFMAVMVKK